MASRRLPFSRGWPPEFSNSERREVGAVSGSQGRGVGQGCIYFQLWCATLPASSAAKRAGGKGGVEGRRGREGRGGGRSSRAKHPSGRNPGEASAGDTRGPKSWRSFSFRLLSGTRLAQLVII